MDPKDEIKQKIDIVELVGEYVQLKVAGSSGLKGLCPFHGEKTPSFHVSRDRQIWHCFGCGEGGDCFAFTMKMDGMSFPEALMHLGKKTGVEVRRLPTVETNAKSRMYQVNELAQKFFRKVLLDSGSAASARAYVESRAIPLELAELFGIGFAPDEWDALSQFLRKRGFSEVELIEAGVSLKKKSGVGVIDRFRNRLMIPLRDHHGNTVGFTGRSLPTYNLQPTTFDSPKYMNSPETPVYHKGSLVFGLDLAKRCIREKGFVVIVEGNLDVVASHKAYVENIIASSGTALTQDQLILLKRYTETAVFAFDADAAGFAAAKKGISLARGLGFDVRAAILPDGVKDPDELVQKDPTAWKNLVEKSVPIMEFLIAHVTKGKDLRQVDDKRVVAKELLPAISEMSSVVEREHWLQIVADLLSISSDQLRSSLQPKPSEPLKPSQPSTPLKPLPKDEQARRLLFGYAIQTSSQFQTILSRLEPFLTSYNLQPTTYDLSLWITLYKLSRSAYDPSSQAAKTSHFSRIRTLTSGHPHQEALEALLDTSLLMAEETFGDIPESQMLQQIEHLFSLLNTLSTSRDREALARALRQAELAGDEEEVKRLLSTMPRL
ncbi:DNA primase [Candidatus Uhrbacteria bacterium]|nr:DNA primase [Candidatus Uhrbacteria bacterium]